MRFAWTDDFGFTEMYAQEESPRVIAAVRDVVRAVRSGRPLAEPVAASDAE